MGSETRNLIVTAAAALFDEHGYHATGVSAILEAAGVNSGSLYHFFDTKEDLLAGVMERHLERLGPALMDPVQAMSPHARERIGALAEHYRRTLLASGFERGCPVGALALEVGDEMAGVRLLIDDYFSAWIARVARWLDIGRGRLPSDIDRGQVARLALSVVQGGMMQAKAARSIEPYDQSVSQLLMHLEILANRPRARPTQSVAVRADDTLPPEDELPDTTGWRSW